MDTNTMNQEQDEMLALQKQQRQARKDARQLRIFSYIQKNDPALFKNIVKAHERKP